jgi:MFS family permease
MILYLDRAAISSAKASVATALSLSDAAMGAVFSAFALGYAFAQIPSGWLADRFGPRVTLACVVALWSVFTVLTGVASGLFTLFVVRFLFGAAEAGAFPGSARVIYNWLPPRMHGIANGILFSGALVGGAVAFPFFQWLLGAHGWRMAFFSACRGAFGRFAGCLGSEIFQMNELRPAKKRCVRCRLRSCFVQKPWSRPWRNTSSATSPSSFVSRGCFPIWCSAIH